MVSTNGLYSGHGGELDITQNTEVLRGEHFKIAIQGMFLVAGIQNTNFKVGQYTWRLGNGETCPENTQPRLNRHVVAVIDGLFIHYDIHNGSLFKYPLQYLVGDRQEEKKYLVRVKKVYGVKPKFQEDWIHRLRHVTHVTLNIGCICVGKKSCILSRWKEHCSNQ